MRFILTLSGLGAAAVLAVACSDYELKQAADADGTDSAAGLDTGRPSPPGDLNACDAAADPGAESVDLNDECDVELKTGSFDPIVEWSYGSGGFCGPAAAGQIIDTDGSGAIDSGDMPIILIYDGVRGGTRVTLGRVVALYGDGSGVAWQSAGTYGGYGGMAIGDVDGDGWPDVITAGVDTVCALDGSTGAELWCTGGLAGSMDGYSYNYPAVADMEGDGIVEVTIGDAILHGPTGALLGRGGMGIGAAPYGGNPRSGTYGALSVPVDIDGDGEMELVTGNAAYGPSGELKWSNTGNDGLVAVADFDGDGQGEIVKTTGNAILGMETDGTEVWGPVPYNNANVGAPAIDDLDGDGTPEIVFAARDDLIAMEWGGAVMWTATIDDQTGAAGPVLFDFEMDGYPEVLYADETSIRFFSGLDGSMKYYSPEHSSATILETPIVADVDRDGQVEIVLGHCDISPAGSLTVFGDAAESWPPGRTIWNQHAYSITNIDDLGSVPGPVPNWELYNSFRSGDVGRPPSEFWDLRAEILDVCEEECAEGTVYVAARINNAGNIEAPAGVSMSLRAGAGGPILSQEVTTRPIPPETTGELLTFEVIAGQLAGTEPVVTADEDRSGNQVFYECDETNNVAVWPETVCD